MTQKCVWMCCIAMIAGAAVSMWALFLFTGIGGSSSEDPAAVSPTTENRQLRYGFTVRNSTGRVVPEAFLHVYAPVRETSTQFTEAVESSHPYELIEDCLGNQILRFELTEIPPYGSRIIKIKADLTISSQPEGESALASEDWFLSPEIHVESDHPLIAARASTLRQKDPWETAEAIFRWVAGHIEYSGYRRHAMGALNALIGSKGDCTEYMDLFAALSRAADIPCRRVGGYIAGKNSILSPSGYHNWAEFYMDGRWHVADPQRGVFREGSGDYIAMRIISEHCPNPMKHYNQYRVAGDGIRASMNP